MLQVNLLLPFDGFASGLLLDPEHPRNATDETIKTAVQRDFAECIQQISLYPAGAEALKADPALIEALDALVEKAWSDGAKECARGALMQLTERQPKPDMAAAALHGAGSASHRHIMLSYSWEWQPVVRKICAELQRRKYLVWVPTQGNAPAFKNTPQCNLVLSLLPPAVAR